MQDPRKAYDANWVPVHILQDRVVNADDDTEISEWSIRAVNDAKRARRLEKAINRLREQVLLRRDLHYCELDAQTERDTAIDIFVQSNKSSVKVNEFDIAVALASQTGDENLRERITEFHRHSDVMRQYFTEGDDDEERVLAKLGEWLLFSACLTVKKLAPKRRHFEDIVRHLSQLTKAKANEDLNQLLKNLETALHTLGDHGSPTEDTLPARPPLHVIAGLQDVLLTVTGANRQGVCNKVISAYLWRAFLTERYETKANDRLFEDYEGLLVWIREVNDTGRLSYDRSPPIFDKKEYPLPDATTLGVDRDVPWIKGRRRLGRAIASLTLFCGARDWVTGNDLHARNVRGLVERRKLERHHVFPRAVLRKHGFPNDMVNHGLNGVLLSQQANQTLSKKDPADYMKAVLQQQGATLTEKDLRDRVESHLVPYDVIISGDSLERRFETFITERARIFARKIEAVANLSQG